MAAVAIVGRDDPDMFEDEALPMPQPGAGERVIGGGRCGNGQHSRRPPSGAARQIRMSVGSGAQAATAAAASVASRSRTIGMTSRP